MAATPKCHVLIKLSSQAREVPRERRSMLRVYFGLLHKETNHTTSALHSLSNRSGLGALLYILTFALREARGSTRVMLCSAKPTNSNDTLQASNEGAVGAAVLGCSHSSQGTVLFKKALLLLLLWVRSWWRGWV